MTTRLLMGLLIFAVLAWPAEQERAVGDSEVREAVSPNYEPLAVQGHISGVVEIVVDVNEAGTVSSAEIRSGHVLLRGVSLEAARQWKFDNASGHRRLTLTFVFRLVGPDSAEKSRVVFKPPYTVEVSERPPSPTVNYGDNQRR